jgi:L-lactate dehydrogenase
MVGAGDLLPLTCLSVPAVVGRRGVLSRLPLTVDEAEQAALSRSAAVLRAVIDDVT